MMIGNSVNRKLGSFVSVINMFVSVLIGLIFTPLLVRYLGDNEYGIYTLALSIIGYLSILDLGFGNAIVRYTSRYKEQGMDESKLIGMFLIFYSIIALICLIIGYLLYINLSIYFPSFKEQEITILKQIFIILLLNTAITFPSSVFSSMARSHEKFVYINSINLFQNVINHGLMIMLLVSGFKSISLALVSLVSTIIVLLFNLYYCFFKLKIRICFEVMDAGFYKDVFIYSLFIFINIIVDQLYSSTDKIILARYCGSLAVAVYGIGVTFQQYLLQFSISISSVFLPHISKLSVKREGKKELSDLFINIGHIQLLILTFLTVGFVCFGKDFIYLWVGDGYEDAYFIALIIMVPAIVPLSQNIGVSILQAYNKHKVRSLMYLIIAILNVVISIPLSICFSGIGAAIGTAIGTFLGQILFMNWYYTKKIGLNVQQYWRNFVKIFIGQIPVYLVFKLCLLIPLQGWIGLGLKVILGIILVIPYYYFFLLNIYEKHIVDDLMGKVMRLR